MSGFISCFTAFFFRHRKVHIWLFGNLLLLFLFFVLRRVKAAARVLTKLADGFRWVLGGMSYLFPFSLMEVFCSVLLLLIAVILVRFVIIAFREHRDRQKILTLAYRNFMGIFCGLLTLYTGFCYLLGIYYETDNFQTQSGIYAEPVSINALTQVTRLFADNLIRTADTVTRGDDGVFAVSPQEILEKSAGIYQSLYTSFPFLKYPDNRGVKSIYCSRIMSMLDFTGVYCPFTGEANVNIDSPACMLPATCAHELAHMRGYVSEEECNFLAVLAATASDDSAYVYSGWLFGYVYLSNALYSADREAWTLIRDSLPLSVRVDLQSNNDYWSQFRNTPVQKISNTVYDQFLKSYGDEDGIQSYGAVVDLLTVYYKNT